MQTTTNVTVPEYFAGAESLESIRTTSDGFVYVGGATGMVPEAIEPGLDECAAALSNCRYLMVVPVPWYVASDGSI
ncbi:MAG: hypothetical protein V4583_07465, partial [Pseudomonadota bacterium]